MERALKRRRHRPVLVIDGGVPGDVEPTVDELDDAFVYTLDDLEQVARQGRAGREAAAEEAWRIVDGEVAAWRRARAERDAVPTLVALRSHFEAMRDEVLAANPGADAAEATRRLVNRLLHLPSEALRGLAGSAAGDSDEAARLVAGLFGLAAGNPGAADDDSGDEDGDGNDNDSDKE
jgi:glutamyl-tRNA reductase